MASELVVITKARDLAKYVFTVTQKSPKCFRFSLIGRMHNLCSDILADLIRANDTFIAPGDARALNKRISYQENAMTNVKLLGYFSMIAMENNCIQQRHYAQISEQITEVIKLLYSWSRSDKGKL